jgi:hypothetical protein
MAIGAIAFFGRRVSQDMTFDRVVVATETEVSDCLGQNRGAGFVGFVAGIAIAVSHWFVLECLQ